MQRLMLLRHAKSAWPDGVADHDRPLAPRGEKAAPVMGRYLAREGLLPKVALVSSARRTQETFVLVRPMLPPHVEVRNEPAIYEAPAARLLEVLRSIEPADTPVLMVGHNPAMEDLAGLLAGTGDGAAMDAMRRKFPTSSLAVIDFDCTRWNAVTSDSGRLERFVTPRMLERE
jgi:phosphohistidine phosphatase